MKKIYIVVDGDNIYILQFLHTSIRMFIFCLIYYNAQQQRIVIIIFYLKIIEF